MNGNSKKPRQGPLSSINRPKNVIANSSNRSNKKLPSIKKKKVLANRSNKP